MQHTCMQDPSFTVNIPEAHTSFLPLSFTPKGDPTTYSNLPTPSGSRMQITPPTVSDSGGATCTAYFPAGPNAEPGIQLLLLTIWAGGDAVGALFGASGEWFAAERPAPEWLAALEAAFPGVPSVWLQEAAETLAGGSLRVRCATGRHPPGLPCRFSARTYGYENAGSGSRSAVLLRRHEVWTCDANHACRHTFPTQAGPQGGPLHPRSGLAFVSGRALQLSRVRAFRTCSLSG